MQVVHSIPPVFDKESRVLILGSFPSVRSREVGFFYGHPQNRFWSTLSSVFDAKAPQTEEEKKLFLLEHHIALWDVIASCEIRGSSDSSIKNVVPNDVLSLIKQSKITKIYTNGGTAHRLYCRYLQSHVGIEATCLPSTSPANAAWSLERLREAWQTVSK